MERGSTNSKRILQALGRTSSKAVDRDREAFNA
jgi:hypothetical protein